MTPMREHPRWFHKLYFWILLSAFSAFFAEACCANEPFVLLGFELWLLCVSMYGLHAILLCALACRSGSTTFSALYSAGMIFGLYEAYMTKVLWAGWEPGAFSIGGVAVIETLMLVLFWHPLMSFLIPLVFAERFALRSSMVVDALSPRFQRWLQGIALPLVVLPVIAGAFIGTKNDLAGTALSTLGNTAVLLALLWCWRNVLQGHRFSLLELMPGRIGWSVMLAFLLGEYVLYFFVFYPENLPGLGPQALVWVMYGIVITLFISSLRRVQKKETAERQVDSIAHWLLFAACFVAAGIVTSLFLAPLGNVLFLLLFVIGVPYGCALALHVLYGQLRRNANKDS